MKLLTIFALSLGLVAQTASKALSKETKLLLQVSELKMQLAQTQFKLLEVAFKESQAEYFAVQTKVCKELGGENKDACTFTPDTVELKPKPAPNTGG